MRLKEIYCDGACQGGNPGIGSWALQAHYVNGFIQEDGRVMDQEATNNHAEMAAVFHAVKLAKENFLQVNNEEPGAIADHKVVIFSDSQYVIKGINEWHPGWVAKGWKDVANVDKWQALLAHIKGTEDWLTFEWIKGHSGHEFQERVDELAQDLAGMKPVEFFYGKPRPSKPQGYYPVYLACLDGRIREFKTWDECKEASRGQSGAKVKKVKTNNERRKTLEGWGFKE